MIELIVVVFVGYQVWRFIQSSMAWVESDEGKAEMEKWKMEAEIAKNEKRKRPQKPGPKFAAVDGCLSKNKRLDGFEASCELYDGKGVEFKLCNTQQDENNTRFTLGEVSWCNGREED
jgi:hypothetical protein